MAGVLSGVIAPNLHDYVSLHVEKPITSMFQRGPLRDLVPFEPAFVGRHWSPTEEFDLVLLDRDRRRAFVGEVKWSPAPVPTHLALDLARRVKACDALRGLEVTLALVARSGFRGPEPDGVVLIDLSKEV